MLSRFRILVNAACARLLYDADNHGRMVDRMERRESMILRALGGPLVGVRIPPAPPYLSLLPLQSAIARAPFIPVRVDPLGAWHDDEGEDPPPPVTVYLPPQAGPWEREAWREIDRIARAQGIDYHAHRTRRPSVMPALQSWPRSRGGWFLLRAEISAEERIEELEREGWLESCRLRLAKAILRARLEALP